MSDNKGSKGPFSPRTLRSANHPTSSSSHRAPKKEGKSKPVEPVPNNNEIAWCNPTLVKPQTPAPASTDTKRLSFLVFDQCARGNLRPAITTTVTTTPNNWTY